MKRIVKKLATLLITLGFISMSCAAVGYGEKAVPLGGTPRVETVASTIGMTLEKLDEALGTPHGTDTCQLPFLADGKQATAAGRSFMWSHEYSNMRTSEARKTTIIVCTIDGMVVAEYREYMRAVGDLIQMGQTNTVDAGMIQEIMNGLLKADPSQYRMKHLHRNKGIEI